MSHIQMIIQLDVPVWWWTYLVIQQLPELPVTLHLPDSAQRQDQVQKIGDAAHEVVEPVRRGVRFDTAGCSGVPMRMRALVK